MGKYMQNESLDVMVSAIVEKELAEYKDKLKKNIMEYLKNPYCAKTEIGSVMYENEILAVINATK